MNKISHQEIGPLITRLILGASYSIDLIAFPDWPLFHAQSSINASEAMVLADQRLRLRAIMPKSEKVIRNRVQLSQKQQRMTVMREQGWVIRIPEFIPPYLLLIIDNKEAITTFLGGPKNTPILYLTDQILVDEYVSIFSRAWQGETEVIYHDFLDELSKADRSKIIIEAQTNWDELIKFFTLNPKELQRLDSRKFEELIAELLSREGLDIRLTPPRKDGGRDILAYNNATFGNFLYYVECKRYAQRNTVGVKIARELFGVIEAEKATAGIIVTTSRFTKGALSFCEPIKHRMNLRDYNNLVGWLKNHYESSIRA